MQATAESIPLERTAWRLAAIAGLVVLISGVVGAGCAWFLPPRPAWTMVGFESLAALAGLCAWMTGSRRWSDGAALTLLCSAGVLAAGTFLTYVSARKELPTFPMKAWFAQRAVFSAGLAFLAAWVAVRGRRAGLLGLFKACLGFAPLIAVGAWYRFAGMAPLMSKVATDPDLGGEAGDAQPLSPARLAAWAVLSLVCMASLCYSIHTAVRAVEDSLPEIQEA